MNFKRFSAVLLAAILLLSLFSGCQKQEVTAEATPQTPQTISDDPQQQQRPISNDELYQKAVEDAVFVEQDEIKPLVTITKDSDMVTWNETGDKVLMVSWNKYPDSYPDGKTITLDYGEVWTFTDAEIRDWYIKNRENITDTDLRLEQLIGLPENKGYTHFTAFWVDLDELERPAYNPDIDEADMTLKFSDDVSEDFEKWFDANILGSYFNNTFYPWTRLGYTYDWADNGTEYGLTEFIIKANSEVEVAFTKTTDEFLKWLAA